MTATIIVQATVATIALGLLALVLIDRQALLHPILHVH